MLDRLELVVNNLIRVGAGKIAKAVLAVQLTQTLAVSERQRRSGGEGRQLLQCAAEFRIGLACEFQKIRAGQGNQRIDRVQIEIDRLADFCRQRLMQLVGQHVDIKMNLLREELAEVSVFKMESAELCVFLTKLYRRGVQGRHRVLIRLVYLCVAQIAENRQRFHAQTKCCAVHVVVHPFQ